MNEIPINHPDLGQNELTLQIPSFLGNPKLFFNNIEVKKQKKNYSLTNQLGIPFDIKIKPLIYDPIPKIIINDQNFKIAEPLKWYEYIWMGLPILLVLQGGVLGVIMGIVALKINSAIFRGNKSLVIKYVVTLAINITIILLFLIIATAISLVINS
ncbi:MAG: hypothetical protein COA97_03035 [Flavobacteriales bacterium]|nr:MAG: hypothetical protein COA97_03035 [Flavobacteriales bacterium]